MITEFATKLAMSRGIREQTDIETLKTWLPGCVSVEKTDVQTDKKGIDYIATLRRGAQIAIDAKTRDRGASRFWRSRGSGHVKEPEVALEIWSVVPGGKFRTPQGKTGWTLCEQKNTDLIYYTFDPADTNEAFLVSFHLLRIAFRQNINIWTSKYHTKTQETTEDGRSWQSKAVFVPVSVVLRAITDVSKGVYRTEPQPGLEQFFTNLTWEPTERDDIFQLAFPTD
jgi:hypothetical protein